MKNERNTLREWLLTRHAKAGPKLNALRLSIVTQGANAPSSEPQTAGLVRVLGDIIAPGRVFWKGLGVAWATILLMYLTVGHPGPVNHIPAQTPFVAFSLGQLSSHENFLDTLP